MSLKVRVLINLTCQRKKQVANFILRLMHICDERGQINKFTFALTFAKNNIEKNVKERVLSKNYKERFERSQHLCITYITLHYITLHYITLHYITLHYITLHYIILYNIILYYYMYIIILII